MYSSSSLNLPRLWCIIGWSDLHRFSSPLQSISNNLNMWLTTTFSISIHQIMSNKTKQVCKAVNSSKKKELIYLEGLIGRVKCSVHQWPEGGSREPKHICYSQKKACNALSACSYFHVLSVDNHFTGKIHLSQSWKCLMFTLVHCNCVTVPDRQCLFRLSSRLCLIYAYSNLWFWIVSHERHSRLWWRNDFALDHAISQQKVFSFSSSYSFYKSNNERKCTWGSFHQSH